jgi:hypothetical protein
MDDEFLRAIVEERVGPDFVAIKLTTRSCELVQQSKERLTSLEDGSLADTGKGLAFLYAVRAVARSCRHNRDWLLSRTARLEIYIWDCDILAVGC